MTNWEQALDRYLTTPPEDKPVCHCDLCGESLYEGNEAVKILGKTICMDCIEEATEEIESEEY